MKRVATLMQCGHTAQGIDSNGDPVCVICAGINPHAHIPVHNEDLPNISDRKAKCTLCKNFEKSDFNLAFFRYMPDKAHDLYYCGCKGWG